MVNKLREIEQFNNDNPPNHPCFHHAFDVLKRGNWSNWNSNPIEFARESGDYLLYQCTKWKSNWDQMQNQRIYHQNQRIYHHQSYCNGFCNFQCNGINGGNFRENNVWDNGYSANTVRFNTAKDRYNLYNRR